MNNLINNLKNHRSGKRLKTIKKTIVIEEEKIEIIKDPEILFYTFLLENKKIEEFEIKTKINFLDKRNYPQENIYYKIFKKCFVTYKWKNFELPIVYFKVLYTKSREIRKRIIRYGIKYKKQIYDILESYNPKNINKKQSTLKNWQYSPMESFNNYNLILLKEKLKKEKKLKAEGKLLKSNLKIENENCDIIVKTDNKSMGKMLIFSGKLTELYVDDYIKPTNYLSMEIEEKNKERKLKKEYIYTLINKINFNKRNHINNNKEKEDKLFLKGINNKTNITNNKSHNNTINYINNSNNKTISYFNNQTKTSDKENLFNNQKNEKKVKDENNEKINHYNKRNFFNLNKRNIDKQYDLQLENIQNYNNYNNNISISSINEYNILNSKSKSFKTNKSSLLLFKKKLDKNIYKLKNNNNSNNNSNSIFKYSLNKSDFYY